MPRTCTVCSHPKRGEIDAALVRGVSSYELETNYSELTRSSIERHATNGHIPAKLLKAQEREDVRQALDVVQQLKAVNSASWGVLQQARQAGEPNLVLRAVDRVQKQLELQAKLLGDLDERPVINILNNPQFVQVQAAVVQALEHHPEARESVVRALDGVEGE
jgi:hypothetical protein